MPLDIHMPEIIEARKQGRMINAIPEIEFEYWLSTLRGYYVIIITDLLETVHYMPLIFYTYPPEISPDKLTITGQTEHGTATIEFSMESNLFYTTYQYQNSFLIGGIGGVDCEPGGCPEITYIWASNKQSTLVQLGLLKPPVDPQNKSEINIDPPAIASAISFTGGTIITRTYGTAYPQEAIDNATYRQIHAERMVQPGYTEGQLWLEGNLQHPVTWKMAHAFSIYSNPTITIEIAKASGIPLPPPPPPPTVPTQQYLPFLLLASVILSIIIYKWA